MIGLNLKKYTKSEINKNRDFLKKEITRVTIKSWGDPGSLVGVWLDLADVIFVFLDKKNKIVAFSAGHYMSNNVLNLTATVVANKYKKTGLSQKLNKLIIKGFIILHPIRFILNDLYIVFRTPNPSLYETVYRKINLFPDYLDDRIATRKEGDIFELVLQRFCAKNKFNKDEFIVYDAYSNYPNLIYKSHQIPLAKEDKINIFFEKKLELSKELGNTMVLVGKVSLVTLVKERLGHR